MNDAQKQTGWKRKIHHELVEYWINVVYLTIFFGVFAWYRRLILAQYRIAYLDYGMCLIEALILAKIIMLGDALNLGRRFGGKPLAIPTLFKAVMFSVWVAVFEVIEHTIIGLLHGKGLAEGVHEMMSHGWDILLARCLIVFFAFIPFFAFKELGRVLGEGIIWELFFRRRTAPKSDLEG